MFHPYDLDGITWACLFTSFILTLYSSEDAEDTSNVSWYAIMVSNTKQFQLVEEYLASIMVFYQVAQVMVDTKQLLRIGSIGLFSQGIFSH